MMTERMNEPIMYYISDGPVNDELDELGEIDLEDFDEDGCADDAPGDDMPTSGSGDPNPEWDIVTALDCVLAGAKHMGRRDEREERWEHALDYLKERFQMTEMQVIVIAVMVDSGRAMSWRSMGDFLSYSRLRMMTYSDEIEELVDKRFWLVHSPARERGETYEVFALERGVVTAIRHNEVFVPEDFSGLEEQKFVDRMALHIAPNLRNHNVFWKDEELWLQRLCEANPHLPLCHVALHLDGGIHALSLLLLAVVDYAQYAGTVHEGITAATINGLYPDDWLCGDLRRDLLREKHELMVKGYLSFKCEDGIVNNTMYVLTSKAKEELLSAFKPYGLLQNPEPQSGDRDLISCQEIKEKELFYNASEGAQVARLRQLLSRDRFVEVQHRLADKGLRTGVAVLLSGGPGTGKTETVRQLARETGRDLLMIDISSIKSKWVGESEKNTKAIFDRYKRLCQGSEVAPILFINECDAILGKRMEHAEHSADKMQNAMQNILLQALEDLEGVVICTTNLSQTLDDAFERRFLMKVTFDKPEADVRSRIWRSMIPELSEKDAHTLADHYADFSGGNCENVMRKAAIEQVLNGTEPTLQELETFCREEQAQWKNRVKPILGFSVSQNDGTYAK